MDSKNLKKNVIARLKALGLNVEEVHDGFITKPGNPEVELPTSSVAAPIIKNEMIAAAASEDASVNEVVLYIVDCTLQGFEIQDSVKSMIDGLSPDNLYITLRRSGSGNLRGMDTDAEIVKPCTFMDGVEEHICFIFNDGNVIPVTRDNVGYLEKKFNLSEESIWDVALENTFKTATIRKLDGAAGYMLTSNGGQLGASAILHKKYIAEFAKSIGVKSFVLLPSSVHEIILVPVTPDAPPLPLPVASAIVRDGNKEIPDPNLILADRAYMYFV